jgi:CDP-diacylglycerol---serine O-phosphatidyltransferase
MFIAPRSRRRVLPLRMIVPNLLTTIALCSGLASIHYSLKNDWDRALMAVGVAAIFDMLDGRAARLLRASSPFGAIMDSLSDFLCFGIAPGMLLHEWMLKKLGTPLGVASEDDIFSLAALMTFVLCSALRLARFTAAVKPPRPGVKPSPLATKFFVGMPTPAAAAAVLIPVMLIACQRKEWFGWIQPWMVVIFTFFIAGLMISRVPMFSLKKIRVKRRLVAPLLVCVGLVVVMAAKDLWLTLAIVSFAYVASAPASFLYHRRLAMRLPGEPENPPLATSSAPMAPR